MVKVYPAIAVDIAMFKRTPEQKAIRKIQDKIARLNRTPEQKAADKIKGQLKYQEEKGRDPIAYAAKKLKSGNRWRDRNRPKVREQARQRRAANLEASRVKDRAKKKREREKNLEKFKTIEREKSSKARRENPEHFRDYERKRQAKLRAENPHFRMRMVITSLISSKLRTYRADKLAGTIEATGCDVEFLERHLTLNGAIQDPEQYHIDHIVPCSAFDLTKRDDQLTCFHWTNLQLLTPVDNIRKGDSFEWSQYLFVRTRMEEFAPHLVQYLPQPRPVITEIAA